MALKVKPLGDRVLVAAVEEQEVKQGGIIIPDSAKEKPTEAKVVALGSGKSNDDGSKVAFELKSKWTVMNIKSSTRMIFLPFSVDPKFNEFIIK